MRSKSIVESILLAGVAMAALAGCALFGQHEGGVVAGARESPEAARAPGGPQDQEVQLRQAVRAYMESVNRSQDERKNKVVKHPPDYCREYDAYSEDPDSVKVAVRQTDTRVAPYVAEVTLTKERFATKMTRDHEAARADTNFFRETGTETLTFERRNGKWTKVGSLYMVAKKEENVNGEWVPAKPEVQKSLAAEQEESAGWFRQVWTAITGR